MRAGISLTQATRQTRRRGKGRNTRNQAVLAINGNVPRAPLAPKLPSSLLLRAGRLCAICPLVACLHFRFVKNTSDVLCRAPAHTHKAQHYLGHTKTQLTLHLHANTRTTLTNAQVQCRCPYLTCLLRVCCAVDQAARAVGTVVRRKGRVIRRSCR